MRPGEDRVVGGGLAFPEAAPEMLGAEPGGPSECGWEGPAVGGSQPAHWSPPCAFALHPTCPSPLHCAIIPQNPLNRWQRGCSSPNLQKRKLSPREGQQGGHRASGISADPGSRTRLLPPDRLPPAAIVPRLLPPQWVAATPGRVPGWAAGPEMDLQVEVPAG